MTAIRIIKVPPGEASKRVRQAWVGLVLPTLGKVSESTEIKSGRSAPGGYVVNHRVAIVVLESHRKFQAARWWREHYLRRGIPSALVFNEDVCVFIQ